MQQMGREGGSEWTGFVEIWRVWVEQRRPPFIKSCNCARDESVLALFLYPPSKFIFKLSVFVQIFQFNMNLSGMK